MFYVLVKIIMLQGIYWKTHNALNSEKLLHRKIFEN